MKSTIRNLSGSAVVLPPTFNSLSLGAGQSVDQTYSTMPAADLAQLVALAKAGAISFPGNTGSGILAGLQVTSALTYVLNGQEPSGQPDGSEGFSINDEQRRRLKKNRWATIDQDDWAHNTDADRGFWFQVAEQLKDGRVLVVGGYDENYDQGGDRNRFYDPATDSWSVAPVMHDPANPTNDKASASFMGGVLLKNGKLLVGGGDPTLGIAGDNSKCFLFDPTTNAWTKTGLIPESLWAEASNKGGMVLLDNGNVLYMGGFDSAYVQEAYQLGTRKAYLYTTSAGTWAATGLMATPHIGSEHYGLPGNKAIVIGGSTKYQPLILETMTVNNTYEVYSAGVFTPGQMPIVEGEDINRADLIAIDNAVQGGRNWSSSVMTNTKILMVGGRMAAGVDEDTTDYTLNLYRSSIIVYDIVSNTWSVSSVAMPYPSIFCKLYVLDQENILVVGGYDLTTFVPTAQTFVYNIKNETLTPSADLPTVYSPDYDAMLPYSYPDENAQGAVTLSNKSFLNFCGPGVLEGFFPAGHGDTLTLDKKRGRSVPQRSFTNDELLANKAKFKTRLKRALQRGH
jgi:hypothetical protein